METKKGNIIFNIFSILALLLVAYTVHLNIRTFIDPTTNILEKITAVVLFAASLASVYYCIFGWKQNRKALYSVALNLFALASLFNLISPYSIKGLTVNPVLTPLYIGLSCMFFGFIVALAVGRSPKKTSYVLCVCVILFYLTIHLLCVFGLNLQGAIPKLATSFFSSSASMLAMSIVVFAMTIAKFKRLENQSNK